MKLILSTLVVLSVLVVSAPLPAAAAKHLVLCLDGALVEQQENAVKGYAEFILPTGASVESLRIRPAAGVTLSRVITAPQLPARSVAKELAVVTEREELLHDRLKALSVREEIFKAAAKSQSAKAPRRTRTNPEPLTTIRQGTDYAIAQLESVYQAKRKAEKELAQLAERRSRLTRDEAGGGTLVKVWATPATGKLTASWLQADRRWTPAYQLRVAGTGEASLALHAQGVSLGRGESALLHLGKMPPAAVTGIAFAGESLPVQTVPLKLVSASGGTPQTPLSLSIVNTTDLNLPAGDTACYQGGVYMGKGTFPGAAAGLSAEIICNGK